MTTTDNSLLFFQIWRNLFLVTKIFNNIKQQSLKSIGTFPKRYSYYQINNFERLIKFNKMLLVDKVKRGEILDFNDFNYQTKDNGYNTGGQWKENEKDLVHLLFGNFNQKEDMEFYINLFKNYSQYFSIDDYRVEEMVSNAVKYDCAVVLKVLVSNYKYTIKHVVTMFLNAIKFGSINVLEYLISIGTNVGPISNKIWGELYHFENEYTATKSISKSIETILYTVENYQLFGLKKPSVDQHHIVHPNLPVLIKKLSLENLFNLYKVLSFNGNITLSKEFNLEEIKLNFTNDQLKTLVQDIESTTNPIIKQMVYQIQPFTGDKIKENLLFYEIKYNGSASSISSKNVGIDLLSIEVFSLGDFKILSQENDPKSIQVYINPSDLFRYCPNQTDLHIQFIKDLFTYSLENQSSHSLLSLDNLFKVFVLYSNASYVQFIFDFLKGLNVPTHSFIKEGIFHFIHGSVEMFDVIYSEIKDSHQFLLFRQLLEGLNGKVLNHFKSTYPQDYQNFIGLLNQNSHQFQFFQPTISRASNFVFENFEDFEPILKKNCDLPNLLFNSHNQPSPEIVIPNDYPLWIFKKMVKIQPTNYLIKSFEIIDWILETNSSNDHNEDLESDRLLISTMKYSIPNSQILEYHYFKDGNLLNSNIISMINQCASKKVELANLVKPLIKLIVERSDLDSLKYLIDQLIGPSWKLSKNVLLFIKDQIIFNIIKTNRLNLLLFIDKNYKNQFDLTSTIYVNYFGSFKIHTEVSLFILDKIK